MKQDGKTFVSFVMPDCPVTAELTLYHADDVAAVNRMIDENNLTVFSKDDPKGWFHILGDPESPAMGYAVEWNYENPRRITGLWLRSRGLAGTMDVSGMEALQVLAVADSGLTGLEGLGFLADLTSLSCDRSRLKTLDVSGLRKLEFLSCMRNELTGTLDVSGLFTKLTQLNCSSNRLDRLTGLDQLPQLQGTGSILCHNNPFSAFTDTNGHTLSVR